MPLTRALAAPAAARIRHWVLSAFPRGQSGIDYDRPAGDPGLFGPDSVTWRVHSDFPGMLSGGLCALMLQTLHPLALAGVWDHSNFRTDLVGRLRRTTNFVAGTTYAARGEAQRLIDRVATIHAQVHGSLPDGRSYRADDPDLLTWVHVTESFGFLGTIFAVDQPSSAALTRERFGWEPTHPSLLADLATGDYPA